MLEEFRNILNKLNEEELEIVKSFLVLLIKQRE